MASSLKKRRPAGIFFAALLVIILYFLFFPYPAGRELVARPVWAEPLPALGSTTGSAPTTPVAPFQLDAVFGFVSGNGSVSYIGSTPYRVALSESGFVSFSRLSTDWILRDVTGARVTSFSGSGYPLLSPEGSRFFNVMTSAAIRGDAVVVGLLDGTLLLLNRQGSPVFTDPPGPARIPVIMGAAVANDGSLIASLGGIDPQYLSVLRRRGSGFQPVARQAVASDFRREVRIAFSPDARFLVFEAKDGADIFDPAAPRLSAVGLRGALAGIAFPGAGRYAAVAGEDGTHADLAIVSPSGVPLVHESFSAARLFLGSVDGQLLLAWDGMLARIDVGAL